MKFSIFVIDYQFKLNTCTFSRKSGRYKWKPETGLCFGEFPAMPVIYVNPYQLWFFFNEIHCCRMYRRRCCAYVKSLKKCVVIKMDPPVKEALDYQWYLFFWFRHTLNKICVHLFKNPPKIQNKDWRKVTIYSSQFLVLFNHLLIGLPLYLDKDSSSDRIHIDLAVSVKKTPEYVIQTRNNF